MFTSARKFFLHSVLVAVPGLMALAAPAWGQATSGAPGAAAAGAAEEPTKLEEVVVTARKRNESFQDVPITVNAFTAQQIHAAGIETPRDFIAMVPNMTLVEVQNVGNSFITVRGISQARNSEPSVAVMVDGVLETNPYEFNQELVDIKQIEVLKGPQGALYGRNAIGGAIIINTADPSDHFEGNVRAGVGNGVSEKAQMTVSGPIDSAGTLRYRASVNYYNTDGFLENTNLDKKADPDEDYSARLRLLWRPADSFSADLRMLYNQVNTTAYYYVIPRNVESNPFSSFPPSPVNPQGTLPNANDVTSPIQNNNLGMDHRYVTDIALKLDYSPGYGTFTSTTDYNHTREIDTGDAYDFRPVNTSIAYNYFFATIPPSLGGPLDESQSQFIEVKTASQELRFTSEKVGGFSWIGGAYFVHTERFISTGNLVDRGDGVPAVYYTPIVDPTNPFANGTNVTFLADSQNNNAWAVFADAIYEFNPHWELDAAIRYDQDQRANTTETPPAFIPPGTMVETGAVRKETWDAPQPKATLRYKPLDNLTLYGGWSRGFRSGGFNQTGVGAVAAADGQKGVHDEFDAEIADTWEVGVKSEFLDHRLRVNATYFDTTSQNGYFFFYDATSSTQNLGNLDAKYHGGELEVTAKPTDRWDLYAGVGVTDSKITAMEDPTVIGNQAPLVSRNTINAGAQYRQPLSDRLNGIIRLDYQEIGRTYWDPYNVTSRDPVSLVDLRTSLEAENWSITAWSKNLTNKIYNAEFSTGGFLWRALPRRYGIDVEYHF